MLIMDAIILNGMKMMKCNQKYNRHTFLNVKNLKKKDVEITLKNKLLQKQ